jgi:hypothetical protein
VSISSELQVALSPSATFDRLLIDEAHVRGWRLLRRPAMVLVAIAVLVPIAAVQRVTLALVVTAALSWSFVIAIQMIVGASVIGSAPARVVRGLRALDLWFAGHIPYSLWMLVSFGIMALSSTDPLRLVIAAAIVPAIWTAFIVTAFCRTVLRTSVSGARWRAAAHFVATWAITLSYIAWAAGGWFQLLPWR